MTTPCKRVQTVNPPRNEVGPGAIATWGISTADEADVMVLNGKEKASQVSIYTLNGVAHKRKHLYYYSKISNNLDS